MNSDDDSVDSREGQLQDMRVKYDYNGSDRRNCDDRHPADLHLGEKVKRPLHDSSLLSQFFWGPDDDEMESRPPERKRKWRGYAKRRGPANAAVRHDAAETSNRCNTNWHDLPMELLVRILTLVDNRTVVTASGVCRGWRDSVGQGIHDLSFSWCGHSVSKLVQSVAPKFPRLQSCRLKRCMYLDDAAIQTASSSWHGLKILELSEGRRLTDASLYALANGCPLLEKLDLSGCTGISEAGLLALIKKCNNLRHLNLWECYDAGTDAVLQALAKHCKALQSLNLGWCGQVTDKGISAFARGCSDLRVIDLCRCNLITDQSVVFLSEKCHYLCALGLSSCHNLTDRAMYTLIKFKTLVTSQHCRGKRNRFPVKNMDMASDFRMPRHRTCTSSCSSSGSTCSDASKLPIKREGLDTLLEENPVQHGLVCLNVSHCVALSAQAVQAVCDAFPDLHTCAEQQSLVTSGCLNLTSVNCVCAIEARRDKSRRERRALFAVV
ncbi:hypothetical protein KC19_9G121500 [Ceratodon purpureus]|uniref:F-box domain-containing protein n=1 Tax=Ceratodon purpureus TaxID=3225 RepID=A0A8T0GT26_CERPU|nr:hypothetical protein KC19_9G121500 [Ceratodon purpureus]